jgi:hypothetical protein
MSKSPLHMSGALALMGILLASACALPLQAQDYYSDVRPILVRNCLACHGTDGPGWSMADAEEAYQRHRLITAMVLGGQMPPWIAGPGHQEYLDDPTLDGGTLETFRAWRDQGFPRGEPRPDPGSVGGHGAHGSFRPDFTLEVLPGGSYLPNQERSDDYRCFVVDWPEREPGYLIGFRAVPGNLRVSHHTVIHAVAPGMVERFRELEEAEEGAGYQCFGGALPDRLGQRAVRQAYERRYPDGVRELARSSFWLAHWAPGMDGHRFPEGTGILMEPGSALVVQMHYYSRDAPGEKDEGTRMDFRVAREVERPAFHLPQTRNEWLIAERNHSMIIPPGERATYEVADDLGSILRYISRVTWVEEDRIRGVEVHSVNLHMHAFGHSGVIELVDGHGRSETLLAVPRWDLRWQRDFAFVQPKVFARDEMDGTLLRVRCTFRNPTTETVYGGYGSFDEMCFNFAYIAVRTGDPVADGISSRIRDR